MYMLWLTNVLISFIKLARNYISLARNMHVLKAEYKRLLLLNTLCNSISIVQRYLYTYKIYIYIN